MAESAGHTCLGRLEEIERGDLLVFTGICSAAKTQSSQYGLHQSTSAARFQQLVFMQTDSQSACTPHQWQTRWRNLSLGHNLDVGTSYLGVALEVGPHRAGGDAPGCMHAHARCQRGLRTWQLRSKPDHQLPAERMFSDTRRRRPTPGEDERIAVPCMGVDAAPIAAPLRGGWAARVSCRPADRWASIRLSIELVQIHALTQL